MSLLCYFNRHTPSIQSISRGKTGGLVALCEHCAVPLERDGKGPWRAAAPADAFAGLPSRSRLDAHHG